MTSDTKTLIEKLERADAELAAAIKRHFAGDSFIKASIPARPDDTDLMLTDALASAIAALRAQPPAPSGWQPIETAPKDGTLVDLFVDGHREADCCWHRLDWEIAHLQWPTDSMGWATWSERDGEYGRFDPAPTHWQPFPAPPQTPEGTK